MNHRLLCFLACAALLSSTGVAAGVAAAAPDWQLQYQSGQLNTLYKHYSVIADGVLRRGSEEFGWKPGPAFLGMKVWASSTAEAAHMLRLLAKRVEFQLQGKVEVYTTEPSEPARNEPHAYHIKLTPYDSNKK
jgi:hypothetical protein